MSTVIHLVRHGRIPDYSSDQSLTPEGCQEALAVGRGLAAKIRSGETIRFFSSPSRRARETAALLRQGLKKVVVEQDIAAEVELVVAVDDRLQNNLFYLGGVGFDPMTPLLDIARWRLHQSPSPEMETFEAYQTGFWHAPDPVAYWLTHPSEVAESPQAVAQRTQIFLAERLAEGKVSQELRRDVAVTHSANLRAFLQLVFGQDPGPPPFSGMLTISARRVHYLEQVANFPIL
jgi:broad specificity phosphatase PhoE